MNRKCKAIIFGPRHTIHGQSAKIFANSNTSRRSIDYLSSDLSPSRVDQLRGEKTANGGCLFRAHVYQSFEALTEYFGHSAVLGIGDSHSPYDQLPAFKVISTGRTKSVDGMHAIIV